MTYQLAIIGAGNMAEAIARGLIRGAVFSPQQIIAADPALERQQLFKDQLRINCVGDAAVAAAAAPVILLCVKPQQMNQVLGSIATAVCDGALVISIAAGVSTTSIDTQLAARNARIVRAMPNTPMLVGEGMVAISPGPRASADDLKMACRIFAPAAAVIELPEDKLDAVTALSGSGPAYFFYLVEQMIAAGIEMGLSPQDAHTLAARTAAGAGRMLANSSESPQELRRRVTSPGGTTEAAISFMESQRIDQVIINAIKAAQRRGMELGRSNS